MKKIDFGLNTGCLINRYVEPEAWASLVSQKFGLDCVQLTTELVRPDLEWSAHRALVRRTDTACKQNGVRVLEVFTDAFSRVNHLAHPVDEIRHHWLQWMKRAVETAADLGADSFGSHFGILTVADCAEETLRQTRMRQAIDGWQALALHAKKLGLKHLTWEPMSIRREFGETIAEAAKLQSLLNQGSALPILMCYDVDHGDISSTNPADTDPYAWIAEFYACIRSVHLKQSGAQKDGHRPFIAEYNKTGRIQPQPFLEALKKLEHPPRLFLELSFKEREPADSQLVQHVIDSVRFWRPLLP
jgi:D-erythrulose 1-phosphate 3-epimerase